MWARAIAMLGCAVAAYGQSLDDLRGFFANTAQFTAAEIRQIDSGTPVAKILPTPSADFIYVVGATYVRAFPEQYLRLAGDIGRLRMLPGYLNAGRFSAMPSLTDLQGFDLEADDIAELKNCRLGNCEVQLPGEVIELFRRSKSVDARTANARAREMALDAVDRYQRGGASQLGSYHDQGKAVSIAEHFTELLQVPGIASSVLPELRRYLIGFPQMELPGAESFFFWERVDFGLKPTLRINHAVTYRTRGNGTELTAFAVKQLYASHYFQAALDFTLCIRDVRLPANQPGFYLVSLKGSRQSGLTGLRGGLLRRIVTSKTRTAQVGVLTILQKTLESGSR
ncbi:MAG: hypothetical protein RL328_1405 [Acidobacteriota bacterium]|jgi:hypothetical protein